jgi:hypothetical protein
VIDVIRWVLPAVIGGLGIVLTLCPEWLQDKPHPDEPAYRRHRSLRVVRKAEREQVTA